MVSASKIENILVLAGNLEILDDLFYLLFEQGVRSMSAHRSGREVGFRRESHINSLILYYKLERI